MVEFDELDNRMILKLVYYGPAMSGKTTNLLQLHDVLDQENRGKLTVLDTKKDRTLFFDLLPFILIEPHGLIVKDVYAFGQARSRLVTAGLQQYENERSNSDDRFHSIC